MCPFLLYVHLYCFLNREVGGRQVADPYRVKKVRKNAKIQIFRRKIWIFLVTRTGIEPMLPP